LASVGLPGFSLPGLPLRLEPGRGAVTVAFALHGDSLRASWRVRANQMKWRGDSAGASPLESLIRQVLVGITQLDLKAELSGTIANPALAIRSNLDEAIAGRLRAMLGEELAVAERRLRAAVDSLVEPQTAPLRARMTATAEEIERRLAEQKARLDQAQKALEQRLRELTRLPGIRLP
jgi:hypothetical protein